jgi:hypothetical protein
LSLPPAFSIYGKIYVPMNAPIFPIAAAMA